MKKVGELKTMIMDRVPGISQGAAYKRANAYLEGSIPRAAMFRPINEKLRRRRHRSTVRTADVLAAVPGLSYKAASNRLTKYNGGLITEEQLYAPFGAYMTTVQQTKAKKKGKRRRARIIKVIGNPEWWSLSTQPRRSPETISLGTWEQEQLRRHDKRIL